MKFKTVLLVLLLFCLSACGPRPAPTPVTSDELVKNPAQYEKTTVVLEGNIVSEGKDKSYFLPYVYYDPSSKTTKISLSQVNETFYSFLSKDCFSVIQIYKKTGGIYLPIPVVPAGNSEITSDPVKITGYWYKTSDDTYILKVYSSEEISLTPAP